MNDLFNDNAGYRRLRYDDLTPHSERIAAMFSDYRAPKTITPFPEYFRTYSRAMADASMTQIAGAS